LRATPLLQTLTLVEAFTEAIAGESPEQNQRVAVEAFAESLSSCCIMLCPYGVVMDVWTKVQQNILDLEQTSVAEVSRRRMEITLFAVIISARL